MEEEFNLVYGIYAFILTRYEVIIMTAYIFFFKKKFGHRCRKTGKVFIRGVGGGEGE